MGPHRGGAEYGIEEGATDTENALQWDRTGGARNTGRSLERPIGTISFNGTVGISMQSGTGSAGKTGPPEMLKDTRYSPAWLKILSAHLLSFFCLACLLDSRKR